MDIETLLSALGGKENIRTIEGALTRLRVGVHDRGAVDEQAIRSLGAFGVVIQKDAVQLIFGPESDDIAAELSERVPGIVQL
ncbi:MAG: PTS transporter subunit EIIB [Trueperella sp.]|nr:PTS transporter subunit EIIB [Trueperella sp.]